MKKLISLLLAVVLVATLCVPFTVSAEDTIISPDVTHSITEEQETGMGLAFKYKMNMQGTVKHSVRTFMYAYANGEKVVKLGAIVANNDEMGTNLDNMVIENVEGNNHLLNVEATKLWDWDETYLSYAVRITNIPADYYATKLYSRPYYILDNGTVVYGDVTCNSYFSVWCKNHPVTLPDIDSDVDVINKGRISVSAASIVDRTVSLSIKNVTEDMIVATGSTIGYTCYDKDGVVIEEKTLAINANMDPEGETDFDFTVPDETTKVVLTSSDIQYLPVIELPAIGSDIDVTKQKDRIRVSAAEASFNEDGTIHVALTFKNYTSKWITEETNSVEYTCYDAAGTKIATKTIYIGVIDTKKNPVKTFEFDVPANTAKVSITKSDIVYWTEWA